jgi:hypothetical protein
LHIHVDQHKPGQNLLEQVKGCLGRRGNGERREAIAPEVAVQCE